MVCLAVHLHGGVTSPTPDGEPLDTFLPCQSAAYLYGDTQEATGQWSPVPRSRSPD